MKPLAARRPRSVVLAGLFLLLAAASVQLFLDDQQARRPAEAFARQFTLDRRRPLEIAAMRLDPSADGAAGVVVSAALEDAFGQASLTGLDPQLRALWVASAASIREELDGARALMLEAIARRPGRAQSRFLLGQAAYASQLRGSGATADRQWIVPLTLAGSAAPGLDPVYTFLGRAYLEAWARLPAKIRENASAVWKRALADPDFVSWSVLRLGDALGPNAVTRMLPDEGRPLRAASAAFVAAGDLDQAASLRPRLDRVLRAERDQGIALIIQKRAAGQLEAARSLCKDWLLRTPAADFDDAPGRAQTARVLELWPNDAGGVWRTDPRGELVRFFLNGREKDVRAEVLLDATEALTAVPDTVRARVHLLAGDWTGAEEIWKKSGGAGSFEWTPFVVNVARVRLARGDAQGAARVLSSLSASAAEGCDVLLARRDVATVLGDEAEASIIQDRLRWLRRESFPAEAWSAAGSISLCLDAKASGRKLKVDIQTEGPAIVSYGWNGGRLGSELLPGGASSLTVPLPDLAGRQIFSVERDAGAPVRLGTATLGSGL